MSQRRTVILGFGAVMVTLAIGIVALKASRSQLPTQPVHQTKGVAEMPSFDGANVVLVTLDTTRADHLGCYGDRRAETPNLDALAHEGALFEHCITSSPFTLPSHSSIMTGLYPPFHGVRLNGGAALADVHTTLAESLSTKGYRCGAFAAAFVLDGRWGLNQGFEHYDDDFDIAPGQRLDLAGVQRPGNEVVDAALGWLDQDDPRPFFAWLHFYDPHSPYEPPAPFFSRFNDEGLARLYDGEIAFADSQVGRVLEWLEDRGLDSNTIVIVTADHGESLGHHGENYHGYYIYDDTIHVPLLIRLPHSDRKGIRIPGLVRTIDIMPTVLDLVDAERPETVQGQSLTAMMVDPDHVGPTYAYSESMAVNLQFGWSPLYALSSNRFKFIEAPRSELYDLGLDPTESTNRLKQIPDVGAEMRTALDRLRQIIENGAPDAPEANLDEDTQSMLAALGYASGPSVRTAGEALADPKDMLNLYQSVGEIGQQINREEYDAAATALEAVLAEDPEIPQALFLLATCYRKTGRSDEARVILDRYLKSNPDNTPALLILAEILSDQGDSDGVLAIAQRVLASDDHNTQALELMAGIHMGENDHLAALPLLERVTQIQPKLTRNRNNLAACLVGLGRLDEAKVMLDDILTAYPGFPHAHFHLGLLYEAEGRLDAARAAYSIEVELFPNATPARFNLGNLLFSMGDGSGAEREMRMLIDNAPEEPRAYLLLARILLKKNGDPDEVERLARAGLDRTDENTLKALGYYLLADAYSRQGRKGELAEALNQAQLFKSRIEREKPHNGERE